MGADNEIDLSALIAALREGTVLLTANRRLSRRLMQAYAQAQQAQGETCWPTPQILPWGAWLQKLWNDALVEALPGENLAVLMNPAQNRLVWEQVIRSAPSGDGLLNLAKTADSAARAWGLLEAWHLPLQAVNDFPNEDTRAFAGWTQEFCRICERDNLLDAARLAQRISERVGEQKITMPSEILLLGFDECTPAQSEFLDQIRAHGTQISIRQLSTQSASGSRTSGRDSENEIELVAAWARSRLEADENCRIGVVIPDLQARRTQVERIFDDTLHPGNVLPGAARAPRCFNISAGLALSQYPTIRAALQILRLARGRLDLQQLGSLLRSPYIVAGTSEAAGRAELDARLRRRGDDEIWLADLLQTARYVPENDPPQEVLAPRLLAALEQLFALHRESPAKATHSQWAITFSMCLQIMGWPGERALDSVEYQQHASWKELLDRFSSLEVVSAPVVINTALTHLTELASAQLFQPKTPERPIQILGLLEAAGQSFEHLWVCGLDDENWPVPARPNPWLPLVLQRKYGLPHADANREYQTAHQKTEQFLSQASEVVFSYARQEGDRERRPSPLIAALQETPPPGVDEYLFVGGIEQPLESLEDHRAPALEAGQSAGGSGVIAAQASCPFQAFGRYRLGARALEEPQTGPDARERGQLVHEALQRIWWGIRSNERLQELSDESLSATINTAISEVLEYARRRRPRTYTPTFLRIEQHSLHELLFAWLIYERGREPFNVAHVEYKETVELAGLRLTLKLDRVDETADGETIVLDYKTGKTSASGWDGERPDAPQLPLYALALRQPPASVAYAQIRPGNMRFIGCGEEQAGLPGVKGEPAEDWQQRVHEWREVLTALAGEYRGGEASVAPKSREQSCRYCDLTPLCRIHEATS